MLLVLGAGGQIGRAVCAQATAAGLPVRGLDRRALDITDRRATAAALDGAELVVNCAAYTAVDRAESERDAAFAVNADAVGTLAALCRTRKLPLLQLSTDYVFDGTGARPWRESDPVAPISVYGASKAEGERQLRAALPQHLILRTSWVFAPLGNNFVRTMLRLGRERAEVAVVADQRGGPTAAEDIAAAILTLRRILLAPGFEDWGTYHFSGQPAVSWFEFATAIFAQRPGARLRAIESADYATPARRPANSVLDCGKIAAAFGIAQPDWRPALARMLAQCDGPTGSGD